MATRTGGSAIVESLVAAGADTIFCVPGESFLGVLDALHDRTDLRVVPARHEGGAAFMAAAHARVSGRLGVCMVTRMVGVANASIGIHAAQQDATPLLTLVGQVPQAMRHREALQEAPVDAALRPLTKWSEEARTSEGLGELTRRATRIAMSGRPGPVVLAVPEELSDRSVDGWTPSPTPVRPSRPQPSGADLEAVRQLLARADRPLLVVGEEVLAGQAVGLVEMAAARHRIPVLTAWRRPDAFPNGHPLYLGSAGLGAPSCVADALDRADAVVAIGARLDQLTTSQFTLPRPEVPVAVVAADPVSMGGHHPVAVAVRADVGSFLQWLAGEPELPDRPAWVQEAAGLRQRWERVTTADTAAPAAGSMVPLAYAMAMLRRHLPDDAIVTSDAGNFSGWVSRYLRFSRPRTFLGSISGAMGYAVPAAVGARLARPDSGAVALVGDGGMLMTGAEVETAVREDAPVTVLVFDNQSYGTIRMHQERRYPDRPVATSLGPVDFAAFGRALGARGIVATPTSFEEVLVEALRSEESTVVHVPVDPREVSVDGGD